MISESVFITFITVDIDVDVEILNQKGKLTTYRARIIHEYPHQFNSFSVKNNQAIVPPIR